MNREIIGDFKEITPSSYSQHAVLFFALNDSHYELAKIIASNSKLDSYIYFENHNSSDFPNQHSNFKLVKNYVSLAGIFAKFTKLVIFSTHPSINAQPSYLKVLQTAIENKIDIYEVPHGLFQSGYNLVDDAKYIDIASYYDSIGDNLPSITKNKAWWYGEEGIGYPRTMLRNSYPKRYLPVFNLITTNTNWYLYSIKDKRHFFKTIIDYAKEKKEELFIWSPHPAEMNPDSFSFYAKDFMPKNILIYGLDKEIYFHGIEGTNDLIPYCKMGITTLSTCLLDYEIHNKGVNLFTCNGVKKLTNKIEKTNIFEKKEDIDSNPTQLETGFIKDYSPDKFDEFISRKSGENSTSSRLTFLQ
ncbi:hypothetical protein ACLEE6_12690 [Lonsdalea quercina]|uniref:hypothetical protein n=1 Tax=Lonsdalea quercina TaxID=71657 RepID=UPI0039749558